MVDEEVGVFLVRLARAAIEEKLGLKARYDPPPQATLSLERGVFVTLREWGTNDLRGCMGMPTPRSNIVEDTRRASILAAFHDPRFPPLGREEVDAVILEVTLLSIPERLDIYPRTDLPGHIRIGVDGLIIESGDLAGLLLPQVPVEYGWDTEEFLMHLCLKAGLRPTDWLRSDVTIYRFSGEIFAEEAPRGPVKRLVLAQV